MSITNNEYECNTLIVEISYGFGTLGIDNALGYWDSSLQWHEGKFNPQGWMVEEMVNSIEINKK
jgi:hypothetical protein